MSFRILAVAVTATTFCITVGVSLWHRRHVDAAEPAPAATSSAATSELPDRRVIAPSAPVTADPRRATPLDRMHDPLIAAEAPREAPLPALPQSQVETPISVVVYGGVATLRNGSNKALDVTVTASNAATGHQAVAHVALAPFRSAQLAESEFSVEPGDHLTLHSPPFGDRELDTAAN